jgi:hypothetical protein
MVTNERWAQAQNYESEWWRSAGQGADNSLHEEMKQIIYAEYMGIKIDEWKRIDLGGKSVLDVGGGPASLLLKCYNAGKRKVIDPLDMPAWCLERYKDAGIELEKIPAEDMNESGWDEVWIYNCLQHVQVPLKVIEKLKKAGKMVRIFEFLEREANEGHPHVLTMAMLDDAFERKGATGIIGGSIVGPTYYGAFDYGSKPQTIALNWINTGTDFPYPYYLAIKSALKTQKASVFNLWLVKEPSGKYYDAIKDLVTIKHIPEPQELFPALVGKPENFQLAHLVDYYRYKLLLENGGVFADLDSVSLSDYCTMISERLVGKDFLASIVSPPHIYHNAIMAGIKGSPLVQQMYDLCLSRLVKNDDFKWGNSGPDVLNELCRANLDRVAEVEYGMLGGCIEMYQIFKPDGKLPDNIRFIHLWANSINGYWTNMTEEYFEKSDHLLCQLVRKVLSPEERMLSRLSLGKFILSRGNHYRPLFRYLKSHNCRKIMEIGTYNGENAVQMIKAAAVRVPESNITYYGFDLFAAITPGQIVTEFSHPVTPDINFVEKYISHNVTADVKLCQGDTKILFKNIKLPIMDMIFIDGGHSLATIENDWSYVAKLMRNGTAVFFDDYLPDMPFIGCKTLIDKLSALYNVEIFPEYDDYPKPFGHMRSQLVMVTTKTTKQKNEKPALHILGLAHTQTTKEYSACAYTQKVFKMCKMMQALGYEIYHYGAEGSNPECSEHIDVVSNAVQNQTYGGYDWKKEAFKHDPKDLAYRTFDENAIREINARKGPKDILLVSMGNYQKPISDAVGMMAVEMGIGYTGVYLDKRIFESYAWMHYIYGITDPNQSGCDGRNYDAVIPNYYDPADFEFRDKKDDYYLYMGRLIGRKGPHIAYQCCERIGARLVMAGQGTEDTVRACGIDPKKVEFVGYADAKKRSELMSHAKAIFVPTIYLEPFGGVNVEAAFCGTPAITTDWGGFVETVQHARTGFRCHTMDDFIFAAKNAEKLDPKYIRDYAVNNYSLDRVSLMYDEYFLKLIDLYKAGWYEPHPERTQLDWMKRY